MRSVLALLVALFATSVLAAPPCYTHKMQMDGLVNTEKTNGTWINKIIAKDGAPDTFLSITVRGNEPETAYIATYEGGCFTGRFVTVPSREVKELFTPIEWGALAARGI